MAKKYDSYFTYFGRYSAEMFQALAYAENNNDKNGTKFIEKYRGKEHLINAKLISDSINKYFETQDRTYLIESGILIMALDMLHQNKCFTKKMA